MKRITKFNLRTLLVIILSLTLCFTTLLSVACNNGGDSSSSSTSSSVEDTDDSNNPTDLQKVANGDFEFSTFGDDVTFPVQSSISWSRSLDSIAGSANPSSYSSGIIDTQADAYNEIAEKSGFHKEKDADGNETEEYYNPGTPFDYGYVSDFYTWDETLEDQPTNDDGLPMQGSKVLMIHNEVKNASIKGTAQKFTSSTSLTLGRNEYAKLSVWVQTYDLVSSFEDVDFGAYITVQNTISNAVAPLTIKNINTNGNWAKYTIYLSASEYATSSFKVILGLGFGSKTIKNEYVEGFAYFDNVNFQTISKEEYTEGVNGVTADNNISLYEADGTVKEDVIIKNQADVTFTTNEEVAEGENTTYTETVYALSHTRAINALSNYVLTDGYTVTNNEYPIENVDGVVEVGTDATNPAGNNVLKIDHATPTSTSVSSKALTVAHSKYYMLTFWVNVHTEYPNDKGLTITVKDLGQGTDIKTTDCTNTVIASDVKTDSLKDEEDYHYGTWRQYVIYICNTADESTDRNFVINFDFGTTEKTLANGEFDLTKGYAYISEIQGRELTEEEYAVADVSNYAYAKKVSLSHDLPNGTGADSDEENNDSYTFNYSENDKVAVTSGQVGKNVLNYTGVVGNSKFVGGENDTTYSAEGVTAGVVNSEKYAGLEDLGKLDNNSYVQPLMIKRVTGAPSFGYVGSNAKIDAGTTALVSVKVFVQGDATAYVYLTSTDSSIGFKVLGIDATGKKVNADKTDIEDSGENLNHEFKIAITAADMNSDYMEDGWLTVRFLITAGDEDISYRVELWNGERSGETATADGTVYFDGYTTSTLKTAVDLRNELAKDYGVTATEHSFTRVPTKVLYLDSDGNETFKWKTYQATTVVEVYEGCKTQIIDLTTIDAVTEIDNTATTEDTDTETEESTSETEESNSFSWALQLTSIIIACVLIALLIVVLVRMLIKKFRKNKGASEAYYNRNSREKAGLAIEAKKARDAAKKDKIEADEEEVSSYDYDNMENNFEEVVEEEVPVEEVPAEEAPVEEVPAEEAPVEEVPAEEAPVEETPAEENGEKNN